MKRIIKFRAWHKKNKKMLFVYSMGFTRTGGISDFNIDDGERFFVAENTDYFELMQYTGRKDKNEKEIYEGDIVMWIDTYQKPHNHQVGWLERWACWDFPIWASDTDRGLYEMEIVGNIYENPELLGVK